MKELFSHHATRISIHALREEGDFFSRSACGRRTSFLSTPSARRATHGKCKKAAAVSISIHALREEGDLFTKRSRT